MRGDEDWKYARYVDKDREYRSEGQMMRRYENCCLPTEYFISTSDSLKGVMLESLREMHFD